MIPIYSFMQAKMDLPAQLAGVLKHTSRSFYLSIAILPSAVRFPVAVAYLLARAADSIADLDVFHPAYRPELLRLLQKRLNDDRQTDLSAITQTVSGPSFEHELLKQLPAIFQHIDQLGQDDRADVQRVVTTLIDGMLFDMEYFANADGENPVALQYERELDRYTYLIAGCVGEFWTRILRRHISVLRNWSNDMDQIGVQLGKALQLTNIVRDMHADRSIGRIYLPQSQPDPDVWRIKALAMFDSAMLYIEAIPRRFLRLRLAVFWPAIIGVKTLAKLAQHPQWWTRAEKIKVTRAEIYRILLISLVTIFSNTLTKAWLYRVKS